MTGRTVLGSCLLSGALWLLPLVPWDEPDQPGSWAMMLIGAIYVAGATVFLAAAPTQVGRWIAAWLVAMPSGPG